MAQQIPWPLVLKTAAKYVSLVAAIAVPVFTAGNWVVDEIVGFKVSQARTTSSIQALGTVISKGLQAQDTARNAAINGLKDELSARRSAFEPRVGNLESGLGQAQKDIAGLGATVKDIKDSVGDINRTVQSIDKRTVEGTKNISETNDNVRSIKKVLKSNTGNSADDHGSD